VAKSNEVAELVHGQGLEVLSVCGRVFTEKGAVKDRKTLDDTEGRHRAIRSGKNKGTREPDNPGVRPEQGLKDTAIAVKDNRAGALLNRWVDVEALNGNVAEKAGKRKPEAVSNGKIFRGNIPAQGSCFLHSQRGSRNILPHGSGFPDHC
jgi:hypothetical protein